MTSLVRVVNIDEKEKITIAVTGIEEEEQ